MKQAAIFLRKLLFPPRCPVCGRVLGFVARCETCEALVKTVRRAPDTRVPKEDMPAFLCAACTPFWYEMPMKRTVLLAKYGAQRSAFEFLAQHMAQAVREQGEEMCADLVVPVPSRPRAVRRRGHDTALLLAKALCEHLALPLCADALEKTTDTRQQHTLTREERRANLLGAFAVKRPEEVKGRTVLLVDDVFTTGATLNECAKMLLFAGAHSCVACCAALTPSPRGRGGEKSGAQPAPRAPGR